ncbi:hypothetical protein MMC22_010251 [Lobaria immixta]|nr:hypothetical protein [Lobaria immixta]
MGDQEVDCSGLITRTSILRYLTTLRNVTGEDLSNITNCKAAVCNALWGSGNPDISGTGMIVGYIFENILGFVLALSLWLLRRRAKSNLIERWTRVAAHGCGCFYESAIFFTFSIQLASIVMLVRLDFGISASGMGDSTAKITWAISLLTMLPLMYIMYMPGLLQERQANINQDSKRRAAQIARQKLRNILFVVCWLLSVYPFLSRIISTIGPSPIDSTSILAWDIVQTMCIGDVRQPTNGETLATDIFGVMGSSFVSLCVVIKLIFHALQRQHPGSTLLKFIRQRCLKVGTQDFPLSSTLFLILPVIGITQIWTILRLRQFQQQISNASENLDLDCQWTFGQVAATTIFVPVLVECCFTWFCQ